MIRRGVDAAKIAAASPLAIGILVTIGQAPAARAQSPTAQTTSTALVAQRFEVASIKPCASKSLAARQGGRSGTAIQWSPGRLSAECQTLDQLIREAYLRYADGKARPVALDGIQESTVSERLLHEPIKDSPMWAGSDRYTVVAEAEGVTDEAIARGPMLQALLEDRFQLKLHSETREIPVYALTVASGGPKLKPAEKASCIPWGQRPSMPKPAPQDRTASNMLCGLFVPSVRGGLDVNGTSIAHLCRNFSAVLDRDVVDHTGIDGLFDIHLDISSEPLPAEDAAAAGSVRPTPPYRAAAFPAAKAALLKLGLRLEPAKGSANFLVIDHAERPSEN